MLYTLRFFFSSKCSLFHNSNDFGSCFIHILYTGVLKFKEIHDINKRVFRVVDSVFDTHAILCCRPLKKSSLCSLYPARPGDEEPILIP